MQGKKVNKKNIIEAVVILVICIITMIPFIVDRILLSKGVTDFNEMKCEDFQNGSFVEGTVQSLVGGIAQKYDENSGTENDVKVSYYLMPLSAYGDEPKYIVVCFSDDTDMKTADKMVEEAEKYFESGTMPDNLTTMEFEGKISKLDKDVEDILYDELIKANLGKDKEECSKYICDYCLIYYNAYVQLSYSLGKLTFYIAEIGFVYFIIKFLRRKFSRKNT